MNCLHFICPAANIRTYVNSQYNKNNLASLQAHTESCHYNTAAEAVLTKN